MTGGRRISSAARVTETIDFSEHPINRAWDAAGKIELFRLMVRIRRFEQKALWSYSSGRMGGWLILGVGQESVATAVRSLLGPLDHSISGPRGIAHALAAGMEMGPCMAEHFGRVNGCSKGKGGAFSYFDPGRHHWGCHGVAAAQTPLAAGLAFALKQREIPGAVVCFLGDGAVNQGVFHESLNLAGLFDLPVVYLIENNGYAMGTSVARSSRFKDCLARRAETYGIDWDRCGDRDIYQLRVRVWTALERARRERRPTVLEVETYRYYGFSVSDANHKRYRSAEEIEVRKARDPLAHWRAHLTATGLIDETSADWIDAEAKAEAAAALEFAEAGIAPAVSDILRDVYWEVDHDTPASRFGRYFFDD
nr:thiamine pyrophosphate-dependent enzyme [Luteolibacter marinus]